jgi:hypothetical protein
MPQEICNIFKWRALHPQPTRKRVPQIVPPKVIDSRFHDGVAEPVPPVF